MHLCAELIAASMMLEPLGEVGANFSLSSRTQFTKINNKKVIAENQCEKHKKSSLVIYVKTNKTVVYTIPFQRSDFSVICISTCNNMVNSIENANIRGSCGILW